MLAELGVLHLLARAGRHLPELPPTLADSVAVAVGWQVRQADVLAGVPMTDRWMVMGRSDTREDRIEVRRVWLRGRRRTRGRCVLSFAAYRQSLDDSLRVGTVVPADVFFYPGAGLRGLVGRRGDADPAGAMGVIDRQAARSSAACAAIGAGFVAEPWTRARPGVPGRHAGARRAALGAHRSGGFAATRTR